MLLKVKHWIKKQLGITDIEKMIEQLGYENEILRKRMMGLVENEKYSIEFGEEGWQQNER